VTHRRRRVLLLTAILAVAAAAVLGLGAVGWLHRIEARTEPTEPAVLVLAGRVERADVPLYLTGIATVQAFNSVLVKARVDGQILKIDFAEGQEVRAGDVIAEIDPRPYAAALAQAKAVMLKDEVQLENAELDLRRYRTLAAQNSIARQQFDTQAALVEQNRAAINADQAQIDSAALQLSYCSIRSPIDGRVGMRLVDVGNMVRATDMTGIAIINQIHPISVVFALPAETLPELRDVMKKGDVAVAAETNDGRRLATGKLAVIDNQINTATATIGYKAVFANTDDALWPGQFVNVRVLVGTRRGAVAVAATAVLRGPDGTYAFVIGQDHRVAKHAVRVAWSNKELAVIDDGLTPGQQVVTDGQYRIQAGTLVDAAVPAAGAAR
jgi:membrane fusion protein, multidrug efflux system